MSAYMIVQLEITDQEGFNEYIKLVVPQIHAYGGRYIVRGAPHENLEGEWDPGRLIVFEFPSLEAIHEFYGSEEYQPLIPIRERSANSVLTVVDGYDDAGPA
ncbi:MAG: DUF1330 domain-containing protein [Dehalococcoidia bacterium]|jgi:uncharacterized protein (DUF1330 family)|nr:DUF1330 domain-containing protein [Dehalococcoidia bacterium]